VQIFNKSKTHGMAHAFVHKALPYNPSTTIATIPPDGNIPATGSSGTVPRGDSYYVSFGSTFGPNIGQLIAATGGVSDNSTVTLTENDGISVS
jgi:hypothetical protein